MPSAHSSDLSMPLATDTPTGLPRPVPALAVVVDGSHHTPHLHIHGSAATDHFVVVLGRSCGHRAVVVGPAVRHSCFGLHYCRLRHHR